MSLLARLIAAIAVWKRVVRHRHDDTGLPEPEADPREREIQADRRAETLVALLLFAAAACAIAFIVFYVVDDDTQLLGLAAGLALALIAAALMVAGLRVVPQVTEVEPRPELDDRVEQEEVVDEVRRGGEGVSRRKLLFAAGGAAGAAVAAAAVVPAASLGPRVDHRPGESPWRRGTRLMTEDGVRLRAADVTPGAFVTAFPEGADMRELGSPVILVRLPVADLRLPAARARWAPEGILAYSKICTHSGCAIALFRSPKYEPTSRPPGLVCPCHYSTFDPAAAAKVVFGPAGRPLPQLPLEIDAEGVLRASGPMSGPVGPAWWGVAEA
ncbi:QcrA and Rieske domain-containing protein [Capillimicrobium parvum]|uniref:Cytochrome bc1 complex Rieske iron-sulfur subunit n=1 Tax=Capillimicrobium parvum TaxID=2884022 RepID=A0A9E6Y1F7_9ACTN|nr:Rieske 2Fe-2S domain-containing protein [Capillimicrobium parvum]UGS38364.1 Cytochrome bc1 complex Rieske iron-sulfur subunit [Capillimicrobium parvum]